MASSGGGVDGGTVANVSGPKLSRRTAQAIIDRVLLNRVTIVIGPTGCGKSTLVPVCVKDELGGPILCTQPRRLAVVAVASRVAENLGVPLGGKHVGYHVGQQNKSSKTTGLVFCSSGILLEDLRANGIDVLKRYECLLIDECHERSAESDLCLTVIRQLLRSHPTAEVRIILMSATFDHARYKSYFHGVPGCETIDTITLETAESFDNFYSRVETVYLDDVCQKLPGSHAELLKTMKKDPQLDLRGPDSDNGRSLSFHLLHLITDLARWLDEQEPAEAPFLIFAPTYRHLEQIHERLRTNWDSDNSTLVLSVLHSSVDIEHCIRSMEERYMGRPGTHPRRILLASAIADSSITIPGVTAVIDTCRSLQVAWDGEQHSSRTVWASRSTCDQRQGRTGRTCAGRVFRLLPKRFYWSAHMEEYETPQLTLSDCRNEAMSLLSSSSNDISDCVGLLEKALDPPPVWVVNKATNFLKSIGACTETGGRQRSKLVATDYGTLMATLPFQIADSVLILRAGQTGYLHEMLLLRAIITIRPPPIITYFADDHKSQNALLRYKSDVDPKDPLSVAMANMSAYMFWDSNWNGARRQAAHQIFHRRTGSFGPKPPGSSITENVLFGEERQESLKQRRDCGVWQTSESADEAHAEFCRRHEINPTSVRAIADTIDVSLKILFLARFEPKWLRCCPTDPIWRRREAWKNHSGEKPTSQMLWSIFGNEYDAKFCQKLQQFSKNPGHFVPSATIPTSEKVASQIYGAPVGEACIHFLSGNCTYGDRCRNVHSLYAKRPVCKYYLSGQCSNGKKCLYLHDDGGKQNKIVSKAMGDPLKPLAPLLQSMLIPGSAKGWFMANAKQLILLGELNFKFSVALDQLGVAPLMSTEHNKVNTTSRRLKRMDQRRIRVGVDATRIHADRDLWQAIDGEIGGFAWNFPFTTGAEEDEDVHEDLILATFLSLALCSTSYGLQRPTFGVTLQGDQLSRWSVLRSAQRSGWRLTAWAPFNHAEFPGYVPSRANGDPFPYENGRLYVFALHTRSGIA